MIIRLALDHTHAGVKHYAGQTVDLPPDICAEIVQRTGAVRQATQDAFAESVAGRAAAILAAPVPEPEEQVVPETDDPESVA